LLVALARRPRTAATAVAAEHDNPAGGDVSEYHYVGTPFILRKRRQQAVALSSAHLADLTAEPYHLARTRRRVKR
jgi:hypothetical protein